MAAAERGPSDWAAHGPGKGRTGDEWAAHARGKRGMGDREKARLLLESLERELRAMDAAMKRATEIKEGNQLVRGKRLEAIEGMLEKVLALQILNQMPGQQESEQGAGRQATRDDF
jgi:hypothetical protein